MTPEVQEFESRKYVRPKVMLQLLPSGNVAVMDTCFNLVKIIPSTPTLMELLNVQHKLPTPPVRGPQIAISTEDIDI